MTSAKAQHTGQAGHLDLRIDRAGLTEARFLIRSGGHFGWIIGLDLLSFTIGVLPAVVIRTAAWMRLDFQQSWLRRRRRGDGGRNREDPHPRMAAPDQCGSFAAASIMAWIIASRGAGEAG